MKRPERIAHLERRLHQLSMVNAAADFADHPEVINGCSDMLVDVFGERGRHARCVIGVGSLTGNIRLKIEATVTTDSDLALDQ